MKILYFTNANLALRRSHVVTILKTSEAIGFASGVPVAVSSPRTMSKGKLVDDSYIYDRHDVDAHLAHLSFRGRGVISGFKTILKTKFDWFYYRDTNFLLYVLLVKSLGKKVVLELHRAPRNIFERALWRVSVGIADKVIVITQALAGALPYGIKKMSVVYGGNYEPKLADKLRGTSKKILRQQLGLPRDSTLVTYTGNTSVYKFDEIFKTLASLGGVTMVIVGTIDGDGLIEKTKEYKVTERVILVGRTDKFKSVKYLFASDILAIPFVSYEPGAFPFKIFEYMGTGRPIVCFKNVCIGEVLKDRENALLVDEESSKAWRTALQSLIYDDSLGERIAQRALKDAQKYTWEARGKAIFSVLSRQ